MSEPTAEQQSKQLSQGPDAKFLCGVAVSVYQNSGDPNSNWAWFEKQKAAFVNLKVNFSSGNLPEFEENIDLSDGHKLEANWRRLGPSVIVKDSKIGKASDFWGRYKEDIQRAKDLGCNSFRISIEWSRLYPKRGQLNQSAVKRYHEIFDELDRQGIEPNVTLHWFVHPRWFDEIGGFTKYENIDVYVEWAKKAFELFGERSKLWATFNEIGVAAMCGFISGNHPPGKLLRFRTAAHVMRNMLLSHARAYKAIKEMPGGSSVEVGVVHNVFWTEPKSKGVLYTHVKAACAFGNRVWGNETIMRFLKTGVFHHWVPVGKAVRFDDGEKPGCDWIGVNHYSRGVVDWKLMPSTKDKDMQPITDMGYPLYPPSLYRACSYASGLGVPVYIMENGMPCKEDDDRRTKWMKGCIGQVERLIDDGFDVRGYQYWTLIDNYEWNFAWELKFGIYEWNPSMGMERRLRKGAEVIKDLYAGFPDRMGKKLATRRRAANWVPAESQLTNETKSEIDFLKDAGLDESAIQKRLPTSKDPVTFGVKKPNGVLRATQLE
jgi:beta-glucosidase/6-phospho-beta-glucosidase/beta-galactosidase